MGLLENETWDDYLNKEVYVTENHGTNGFRGVLLEYSNSSVLVEDENGDKHELKPEYVFGTWILEDW